MFEQLYSLHSRVSYGVPCAKFGLNRPSGSGEEDFKVSSMIFAISVLSPSGKGRGSSF